MISVKGTSDFMKKYNVLKVNDLLKLKVDEAMDFFKSSENRGDKIEKKLWPKKYRRKYHINNLFRYNLNNKRLIYTITAESRDERIYLMLDLLSHPEYDKLFGYQTS